MSPIRVAALSATVAVVTMMVACPPQNTPQPSPPSPSGNGAGFQPPLPIDAGPADARIVEGSLSPDGAACTLDADCESSVCEGLGCGEGEGICAPLDRRCTRDAQTYCGCDDNTFTASGSCPGSRYQFLGGCDDPRPDGASCLDGTDCVSGTCEGMGCDDAAPGTCVAATRSCTKDLRPYCGCDGKTFRTSGSCPGRRYLSTGACS